MSQEEFTPTFNEQKATEAASVLLKLDGGEMNYMKLIKLLYFLDRKSLQMWERPITYDRYFSMKDGQVPSKLLDLVKDVARGSFWHKHITRKDQYTVKLTENHVELKKLSPAEVQLINDLYKELGKYTQYQLGDKTKEGAEYKKTISGRNPTKYSELLSALNFDENDVKEIEETLKENSYIKTLLKA